MSSNIMKRLQRMDFPDCTREGLQYIVSTISSQDGAAIPGLGGGSETAIGEVCQAFVTFSSTRGAKKLSALQELQLLELLCDCFKAAPEKSKYQLFHLMFGIKGDDHTNVLLPKLVSMALSVSCTSVLDCTAIWMQERNCHNSDSLMLTNRLVEDYCLLFPDPSNVFQKLTSISPLFVCNFTTSVTKLFPFNAAESIPPSILLEHVTSWVTSDCTLCCESVRQVTIHGTCASPIPGLMGWCVLGPIICTHLATTTTAINTKNSKMCKTVLVKSLMTLSRLHLGVLQSLDFCQSSTLSQCLLSVTDAMCLVKQLSGLLESVHRKEHDGCSGAVQEATHIALERLGQVLQVAKMAGCLRAQLGQFPELGKVAKKLLPRNRLLEMVLAQQTDKPSLRHTPMDVS